MPALIEKLLIFALLTPLFLGVDIYAGGPISGKFADTFWGDKLGIRASEWVSLNDDQKRLMLMQAKNKTFFDEKSIEYGHIDKMHSMFLQVWFNAGLISFAAFMIMLLLHFANSVQIFWKVQIQTYIEMLGLGLFLGWVGFLGTALFNDSAISVSPYFWAVFGASIASNHTIRFPNPQFPESSEPVVKQKLNTMLKVRANRKGNLRQLGTSESRI